MNREGEKADERTREDTKPTPEVTAAIPEVKKTGELTDDALETVAGGTGLPNLALGVKGTGELTGAGLGAGAGQTTLSNLDRLHHEMRKGIIQNLR